MTIFETEKELAYFIGWLLFLIRIIWYKYDKKKLMKSMLEDLWKLQETQDKCTKIADFTKTYNNREGQIYQIEKIRNKLRKL